MSGVERKRTVCEKFLDLACNGNETCAKTFLNEYCFMLDKNDYDYIQKRTNEIFSKSQFKKCDPKNEEVNKLNDEELIRTIAELAKENPNMKNWFEKKYNIPIPAPKPQITKQEKTDSDSDILPFSDSMRMQNQQVQEILDAPLEEEAERRLAKQDTEELGDMPQPSDFNSESAYQKALEIWNRQMLRKMSLGDI